jgi:hypothetical protein
MTPGKTAAALYCAAVLAIQIWVSLDRSGYRVYYWPFVNYPMYSRSFEMGYQIRHPRLMLQPCDSSAAYELTARAARLTQYEFRDRVLRAVGLQPNRTAEASRRTRIELAGLVARRAAAPVCRMEVWLQLFRIGPEGLELPGSPWRPYAGWAVRDGVITDSAWVRPPERRL